MEKRDADIKADFLLETILKSQPHLLSPNIGIHQEGGENVAEFISALHEKLSAMYQKRN